jgi:hypothetical protein
MAHRKYHLERVRRLFAKTDVLVFTLGLTEAWLNRSTQTVYPTAPGVIAGSYDPAMIGFVNFSFMDIYNDMREVRDMLLAINPTMRMVLTVSPVPLTATASGDHVLVATVRSKSILRAVCASLSSEFDNVDYFPSYEIITQPGARSDFYESNLRSVTAEGVETVMRTFFVEHPARNADSAAEQPDAIDNNARRQARLERKQNKGQKRSDDVVCEDALLEAFSK